MLSCIFFMFLGDFTYTAPPGMWLDYARTGPLSADRFLVLALEGEKGTYHLGGRVSILNGDGVVLYDIPEAENAWAIKNGILGDQDTFLFQTRSGGAWKLWHPHFGSASLILSDDQSPPGSSDELKLMHLVDAGRRLVFLSKEPVPDHPRRLRTVLEVLDFEENIEKLFEGERAVPHVYARSVLSQDLTWVVTGNTLALYDPIEGLKGACMFLSMDLLGVDPISLPLKAVKTAFPVIGLAREKGFLAYTTHQGLVFEKEGTAKPLFVLDSKDVGATLPPAVEAFTRLANAVGSGLMTAGKTLTFMEAGRYFEYDPEAGTLRTGKVGSALAGRQNPSSSQQVQCDSHRLQVTSLPANAVQTMTDVATFTIDDLTEARGYLPDTFAPARPR